MIECKDAVAMLSALDDLDEVRRNFENSVQQRRSLTCYCSVCQTFNVMTMRQDAEDWVDLRGELTCSSCNNSSRNRLLYDVVIQQTSGLDRAGLDVLLFERVTSYYGMMSEVFPRLLGVEFGGSNLEPGQMFNLGGLSVQNEDMQRMSFSDSSLDLVVHSDVLEHVADPIQGMAEIFRVLRPGGLCIFGCPIYSVMGHTQRARLENGQVVFTGEPCYHGDPIREEGVPVFYEFGVNLIDDLREIGFNVAYHLAHSLTEGYLSNNNPYKVGHMWPIVVVCRK